MKRRLLSGSFAILILVLGLGIGFNRIQSAAAFSALFQPEDLLVRGAQLYDDWAAVTKSQPPAGNHPIWARQSTNTRSGPDTWQCVSCHGWDYQGKDGAYRSGSNYTGFPGVYRPEAQSETSLRAALTGDLDPEHDFSAFLENDDISALVKFLQEGLIDDNEFIDPVSLKVLDGDLQNGKQRYDSSCASCHGADGQSISFRFEGQTVVLGTLAEQDPWRFLHRTRFGTARAPDMTIGYQLGWTAQDGRDVLLYAQTFPTGREAPLGPSLPDEGGLADQPGGPAGNFLTGILTALAAMATSLGFAIILGGVLIGVLLLVVWLMRGRKQ